MAAKRTRARTRRLPTVLVLDFWDSYTANILKLIDQLARDSASTHEGDGAGQQWDCAEWQDRVVVVNVDSLSWDSFEHDILPHVDCVILGPGPGTPHRKSDFSWPTRLLDQVGHRVPIFGLCLGCQGLATVHGGSVVRATAPKHGQVSSIRHACASCTSSSLFSGIPTSFDAVQYNSLVVDPHSLPDELEVIAWTAAADGSDEVMALRHRYKPLWGSISSTYGSRILGNFFASALNFHARAECTPNLPPHVLALSTTYRPTRPRAPAQQVAPTWEQRTVALDVAEGWSPRLVFERLVKGRSELGEVWLDSARPTGVPQHSHVFSPQATFAYSVGASTLTLRTSSTSSRTSPIPESTTFFNVIGDAQAHLKRLTRLQPSSAPHGPLGFVGHVGYEVKDVTLPLSRSRVPHAVSEEHDGAVLAFAGCMLSYAHEEGEWSASGLVRLEGGGGGGSPEAGSSAALVDDVGLSEEDWSAWVAEVQQTLAAPPVADPDSPAPAALPTDFAPDQSRAEYMASIEQARRSIVAGDAYELCLTTQFRSTFPPSSPLVADPYPLYLTLRNTNPAPYAAYFHLPLNDLALLSTSPERFLRIDAAGRASMKPIKGTARRSSDPVEDARRRDALEADVKERAENLMIVDLIRNDLLKSCDVESVEVEALMQIETYQTVHQLVTTVVGQLGEGVNPFEAMAKAFPPGSMTGAPKLRSLQLLDDLERHVARRAYSGVFGFLAIDGSSDWAVVIRTLVKRGRDLTLGAGGAITHLSDPAKEWEEVLTKVDAVLGRTA
ncbi:uncharacterized protein RHOBADRAFT_55494 [Rhodotorula graminis WP1]|uniref:aminodeoxychorismate synthase n=1 Tax=Rhodotorula graminis (strain WP1) TaxID=578459 RepID=A0A0P9EHP8_RHOGW|nr:uncharacterized protein RHOBADRAFT_55494 [Rhodotorula graminis WP1]KPV72815.1 hypothetical protein RHOBADRAFT_55494 [Rhodotorula graminis WP1]